MFPRREPSSLHVGTHTQGPHPAPFSPAGQHDQCLLPLSPNSPTSISPHLVILQQFPLPLKSFLLLTSTLISCHRLPTPLSSLPLHLPIQGSCQHLHLHLSQTAPVTSAPPACHPVSAPDAPHVTFHFFP